MVLKIQEILLLIILIISLVGFVNADPAILFTPNSTVTIGDSANITVNDDGENIHASCYDWDGDGKFSLCLKESGTNVQNAIDSITNSGVLEEQSGFKSVNGDPYEENPLITSEYGEGDHKFYAIYLYPVSGTYWYTKTSSYLTINPSCSNECLPLQYPQCNGSVLEQCILGSDGCYDIGGETNCGFGCFGGECLDPPSCNDECSPNDYPKCNGVYKHVKRKMMDVTT